MTTQPQFPTVDPFVTFMDEQQAQERAQYEARAAARYAKHTPIATVIEFKPSQVAVPVYAGEARELIAA
jgi:hypothetical protein